MTIAKLSMEGWKAEVERREALMDVGLVRMQFERSVASIMAVVRAGHTPRLAFSGGKDSSCLACCALEAMRRLAAEGIELPDLHVVTSNTKIENPEVELLVETSHALMVDYGARHGFVVKSERTQPRLSESWWIRIIGGTKLPSFPDGNGDCSVDMKIMPLMRLNRALDKHLKRVGMKPSVTLVGTRFSESNQRAASMAQRGESAEVVQMSKVGGYESLTLSPIAHWETETVWGFLQRAGEGKEFPGYAESYSEIHALYDAASGGGCVLYVAPGQKNRASGCTARTGCTVCQKVTRDLSVENMLMLPEYSYLRGMHDLREYLAATRFDFSRRRWVGRNIDPVTGDFKVFPNNYSPAECERLLRMVLTLDLQERARAEAIAESLEDGSLPRTPRNERMAKPQFQNLTLTDVVAIDYLWSMNSMFPPHHALRVMKEVLDGDHMPVPNIEAFPRVPVPAARVLKGDIRYRDAQFGLRDVVLESALFEGEGITFEEGADGPEALPQFRDSDAWDIDPESVDLFVGFELDRRLAETEGLGLQHANSAARYYHRMGIVAYPQSKAHNVDRILKQADYLNVMGLAGEQDIEQLLARCEPLKPEMPPAAAQIDMFALI